MPHKLKEQRIECPNCGHNIRVSLDASEGDQDYYDECPACCREMHLNASVNSFAQWFVLWSWFADQIQC